ncbi:hypothetical protein TUM3811_28260 [Shewanella algae]|nr:hypothetical protein TUM3811_28260 [Shewanella algae]
MTSPELPSILDVKQRYNIEFSNYAVFMYHPVTTEIEYLSSNIKNTVDALIESKKKLCSYLSK